MRIVHPEHGDMTEEVARELMILNQQANEEAVRTAQRRQEQIAKECGQESRILGNGMRLVAHIDEEVYNYWEAREGRQFWTHELDYMLKRHPELAVKPKAENLTVGYTGSHKIKGKRGRWAL